jgi:glucose/arabinose dehydrogenase
VATGLTAPNWGTVAPGLRNYLFVTDQDGALWAINLATRTKLVFLNLRGQVLSTGERGLLGVAFHPGFAVNGLFYTYTSERARGPADFPLCNGFC